MKLDGVSVSAGDERRTICELLLQSPNLIKLTLCPSEKKKVSAISASTPFLCCLSLASATQLAFV